MALTPLDNKKASNISPPPIKDRIVQNELPTVTFIRYLNDLRATNGDVWSEINKVINAVNLNIEEINRVKVGAGLDTDGNYITPSGTNFIDTSTNLANADSLLDEAIGNISEIILNVTTDYQALENSQLILADASSGEVDITLPNPANMIDGNISKSVSITKTDTTTNKVIISPFGTEKIVNDLFQELLLQGEVLNFITDGTNWWLKA